ncbi:hypothetical protein Q3A66_16470 [Hymenobacter sp. BT770]|uniref:hypothetical protein n=1 Tax=Hymenobacter sp. BT770 TaxID=2886942 RepID=UPI001D104322|nr:hypothetical protein [Hymenobacter sp. BT770]MCC3154611.1 hypothetical protein [Hymenobacter sp. BT770]MDO3416665.1 hypothetical protein [Hymenobacter sp. BT770]
MKLERKDIEFPLWRKKVDASVFKDAITPIPKFLWKMWCIEQLFETPELLKDGKVPVRVTYGKKSFEGAYIRHDPSKSMYRLYFTKPLGDALKDVFVMSYMRSIEQDLRKSKAKYEDVDIEEEIPFWEFLDIEFNVEQLEFRFKAYYTQKPIYTELFQELIKSHILKRIDDDLHDKDQFRFTKGVWRGRDELGSQVEALNVIYNLIDTKNRKIYVGEAESLTKRLKQEKESIHDWDFYRFDTLPEGLSKRQRIAIERLIIRIFASFFESSSDVKSMNVSTFILANKKIDV